MHKAINTVQEKLGSNDDYLLLVDGNDFTVHTRMVGELLLPDRSVCIERGDDKYTSIAAASILAKVERDAYVAGLCESHPDLDRKYGLLSNKGYGTSQHMQGIRDNGITEWHRKTFGLCREYVSKK
jgi:ribonuclease HII